MKKRRKDDRIAPRVDRATFERLQARADRYSEGNVSAYVRRLIDQDLLRDAEPDPLPASGLEEMGAWLASLPPDVLRVVGMLGESLRTAGLGRAPGVLRRFADTAARPRGSYTSTSRGGKGSE